MSEYSPILSMDQRIKELEGQVILDAAVESELRHQLEQVQARVAELEAQSVQSMANKVCGDLPDGWVINLCMENGAAWVEAIKPSGYTIEIDGAEMSLVEQIDEAMKQAFGTDREAGHE